MPKRSFFQLISAKFFFENWSIFGPKTQLARACGVPAVGVRAVNCWQWRSGHYTHQSFPFFLPIFSPFFLPFFSPFFSPSRPFLTEGVLGSKSLFSKSCLDNFPDPVGHFGAPWRPFWILQTWIGLSSAPACFICPKTLLFQLIPANIFFKLVNFWP